VTIQGAGVGDTIIHKYGFTFKNGVNNIRVTGFTFDGNSDATLERPVIYIGAQDSSGNKDFRIDHCKFKNFTRNETGTGQGVVIMTYGYTYGVIDHNIFENCLGEMMFFRDNGKEAWDRSQVLGKYTTGVIFIEDNKITLTGSYSAENVIDGARGSRIVFRYNTVTDNKTDGWGTFIADHGYCFNAGSDDSFDDGRRGTVSIEVYENTFTTNNGSWKRGINLRGGTSAIYNNSWIGNWSWGHVRLTNYRSWRDCGTEWRGPNCQNGEGYPCQDQINNVYIWNNKYNGGAIKVEVDGSGNTPNHIKQGRDYFLKEMPGYTPYPYPHPLTIGSDSTPSISAPQDLKVREVN
jgi:hypothetical protein